MSELIYIAGPFFTFEQKESISLIEDLLDKRHQKYFSPREYGVIVDEEVGMNPARISRIFDMNIRMVKEATIMIAITDNFDPGTMFEIGAYHNTNNGLASLLGDDEDDNPLITYSPAGYGANVMIARASWTHCKDIIQLEHALNGHQIDPLEAVE